MMSGAQSDIAALFFDKGESVRLCGPNLLPAQE